MKVHLLAAHKVEPTRLPLYQFRFPIPTSAALALRRAGGILLLSASLAGGLTMRAEAQTDFDNIDKIRIQLEDTPVVPIDESRFTGPPPKGHPLPPKADTSWVDDTLAAMTIDEKIGQLLMTSQNTDMTTQINDYHIGGFVFLNNNQSAQTIVNTVNTYQAASPVPLWFTIDAEAGLGARVADATIFPLIMAQGAANDAALTEECGRVTARECHAIGIQAAFGPVVDCNTEPINPIISTRAYSDNPYLVAKLAAAFLTGARGEGLLCTLKHYPGHGATAGDSHSSLPTVDLPMSELQAVHIKPYSILASQGEADIVMTAHVWYSQVDTETPWPATLSSIFNKDILRDQIGFQGILISDSYGMTGLEIAVPDRGERGVIGIENGLDVILDTTDMGDYYNALKTAVSEGRITEDRINQSVRRVLEAKSRAGLENWTPLDPTAWQNVLNNPDHRATVRSLCEKGFTCCKPLGDSPAIDEANDKVLVFALSASTTIFYRFASSYFTDPFMARVTNATLHSSVSRNLSNSTIDGYIAEAANYDKIVIVGYDWTKINSNSQVTLINRLAAETGKPVIYVSFGAPYHYLQIPGVQAFYCGYSSAVPMQEVAVQVLLGDREAVGHLPVQVEGLDGPPQGSQMEIK